MAYQIRVVKLEDRETEHGCREDTTEIYEQRVEDIDLYAVIMAVNKPRVVTNMPGAEIPDGQG